jgi:NADH-quinone oxidoreductase subunit N
VWLAVAGVLNSALSLYYYVRVIKYMYVEEGPTERLKLPKAMVAAVLVTVIATIVIGLYPGPVIDACQQAARAFFA